MQPRSAPPPAGRSPIRLWLYGLGMLIPALAFAWRYPLGPNSNTLTDIGKLSQYGQAEFAGYVGGMALLFVLYLLAIRESQRLAERDALPAVMICGAFLTLALAWVYPVNAIDIFLYGVRSRLLTEYGVNPNGVPFLAYANDPWMPFATQYWAERVSPYGPLWNLVAAPFTLLSGERMLVALVGYKLLAAVCVLAGARVLVSIFDETGRPHGAAAGLCYLWNPLVLWEGVANGHNDVLLALLILLALLAWFRRRNGLVIPLLVLATLLKYVTLPLLPLAVVALLRHASGWPERWQILWRSAVWSALAVAVTLFPFYEFRALLESLRQQNTLFYTSPMSVAVAVFHDRYPVELITLWASTIGAALLCAVVAWQMLVLWRHPERLPRAWFEVLFTLLLVAVASSRAWYLIWLVALGALLRPGWAWWRALAWSAGGLASYAFFIWIEAWWQPGYDRAQVVGTLLMLGPPLAVTLGEALSGLMRVHGATKRDATVPPHGQFAPLRQESTTKD